jgi:hypothetical protein
MRSCSAISSNYRQALNVGLGFIQLGLAPPPTHTHIIITGFSAWVLVVWTVSKNINPWQQHNTPSCSICIIASNFKKKMNLILAFRKPEGPTHAALGMAKGTINMQNNTL